jgi:hypothetical protein
MSRYKGTTYSRLKAINLEADVGTLGSLVTTGPIVLPTYTVATAPAAAPAGSIAYISNGAAGSPVLAFSDGTDWLRSDTRAAIAAA